MIQIRKGHIRYAGVENGDACFCGKKNLLMTIYPNRPWRMVVSSVAARGGSKYMIKVHEGNHEGDHPEYTEAQTEAPTNSSQPKATKSPTAFYNQFIIYS